MMNDYSGTVRMSPLLSTLARYENSLEQPIIPGEFRGWIMEVREAGLASIRLAQEAIFPQHYDLIVQLRRQDSELAARAEQLMQQHDDLQRVAAEMATSIEQLAEHMEGETAEETPQLLERAEHLIKRGLKWIIDLRTQDAAVATWFHESLNRERGAAD
jgi:response regulator RpfG family c-di-GMP phosphodiesterase